MGKFRTLLGLGDEAAKATDDVAGATDEVVETADDVLNQNYRKALTTRFTERAAEQPSRAFVGANEQWASALTKASVGTAGLAAGGYTAGKGLDYLETRSEEMSREEYLEYLRSIEENPNLTPEEKRERREAARAAYENNEMGPSGPSDWLGNFGKNISPLDGGMVGMLAALVGALLFVLVLKQVFTMVAP
jgi:hypothetical protein